VTSTTSGAAMGAQYRAARSPRRAFSTWQPGRPGRATAPSTLRADRLEDRWRRAGHGRAAGKVRRTWSAAVSRLQPPARRSCPSRPGPGTSPAHAGAPDRSRGRHQLPIPPLPSLKAAEEPFRMHRRPGPATRYLQDKPGHIPAIEIIKQRCPESILRRIDHHRILARPPQASGSHRDPLAIAFMQVKAVVRPNVPRCEPSHPHRRRPAAGA